MYRVLQPRKDEKKPSSMFIMYPIFDSVSTLSFSLFQWTLLLKFSEWIRPSLNICERFHFCRLFFITRIYSAEITPCVYVSRCVSHRSRFSINDMYIWWVYICATSSSYFSMSSYRYEFPFFYFSFLTEKKIIKIISNSNKN